MTRRVSTAIACLLACVLSASPSCGQSQLFEFQNFFGVPLLRLTIADSPAGLNDISDITILPDGVGTFFLEPGAYPGPFDQLTGPLESVGGALLGQAADVDLNDILGTGSYTTIDPDITITGVTIRFGDQSDPDLTGFGSTAQIEVGVSQEFAPGQSFTFSNTANGDFVRLPIPEPATATALIGALMTLGCVSVRRRS